MSVNPVRQLHVSANPVLDQVGMVSQQFRAHDQVRSNELSLRPQIALLEKEPPVTFADQARRPWFRRPRRIEFFLQEKC